MSATEETAVGGEELHFPDGLRGFPELRQLVLIELREAAAFQELQSVDDPDVSMIVCVP